MLPNLGTINGINSAPYMTKELRELMRTSGKNVPLSVDIMMQKRKLTQAPLQDSFMESKKDSGYTKQATQITAQ